MFVDPGRRLQSKAFNADDRRESSCRFKRSAPDKFNLPEHGKGARSA